MLPGKKYKPEDFVWIAWTRKWFLVVPTVIVGAATFIWAWQLPDLYSSATTILVIPQRVPESYVESTVTSTVAERLNSISQEILSRTRLERIIEEFGLYSDERKTLIMEDIVQLMRTRDIDLSVENPRRARRTDTSSFSVSFKSPNPRTAMLVADRLASMFVQANVIDREQLADSTSQFLQSQLEDSRRRLLEQEAKVEAFQKRNAGQLPAQAQSNVQMLQVTQNQIQQNADAGARERDRLSVLQAALADASAAADQPLGGGVVDGSSSTTPPSKNALTPAQQLQAARTNLRSLEGRFTPSHPDVTRAKREIIELEARVAEEAARVSANGSATTGPGGGTRAETSKLSQYSIEAEQLRKSLETRQAENQRLQGVLASYKARLEMAPKLESELTELTRDYTTLEEQYKTLLKKSEEAKLAVNLERRQIGEQFKVIDGARLPERPISPDRLRLNLIGLFAGLAFGVALIGLLEYRDTRFKTDDDVIASLALPVLAVIPAMVTTVERLRRRRRRWVLGLSSLVIGAVGVAGIVWRLDLLRYWVR